MAQLPLQLDPSSASANSVHAPFKASHHAHDTRRHLLLCASGSVATIKLVQILHSLSHHSHLSIRLILTTSAAQFLAGQSAEQPPLASLLSIPNVDGIYGDADEWAKPWERGDPILHIELRRWANLMVVAPLSADMLARVVGGLADGLLGSVIRAWDTTGLIDAVEAVNDNENGNGHGSAGGITAVGKRKRIVVAPAMNTAMWRQPVTAKQVRVLEEEWGVSDGKGKGSEEGWFEVLRPEKKELACGDVGDGAMRDWREIVTVIEERLGLQSGD